MKMLQSLRALWSQGFAAGVVLMLAAAPCVALSWVVVSALAPSDAAARTLWAVTSLFWGPVVLGGMLRHLANEGLAD